MLGCLAGAAKAGECASGAAGAVIGEIVGEAVGNPLIQDGEFSETDERLVKIAGTTAAIFGTSALGGDFNVASDTAQNAIENNALWILDYLFSAEELSNAELYPEEKEGEENQDEINNNITEAILTTGATAKCLTKAKGCLNIFKKQKMDDNKTQKAIVRTNKHGDKIFISKDGTRKIRFDIKNPSNKPETNIPDRPHGHVEELKNGDWIDVGPHRIYPRE